METEHDGGGAMDVETAAEWWMEEEEIEEALEEIDAELQREHVPGVHGRSGNEERRVALAQGCTWEVVARRLCQQLDVEAYLKQEELEEIERRTKTVRDLITQLRSIPSNRLKVASRKKGKRPDGLYVHAGDHTVQLVCSVCKRWRFLSPPGFMAHCRVRHHIKFASIEEAIEHCGSPVDDDAPIQTPFRVENFKVTPAKKKSLSSSRSNLPMLTVGGAAAQSDQEKGDKASGQTTTIVVRDDGRSLYFCRKRVVIGNTSRYVPPSERDSRQSTYRWMAYVRPSRTDDDGAESVKAGPELVGEKELAHLVSRVRFHLHPSFQPNDVVDVLKPPFRLVRNGWGEFPLRIQIFFNESLDIKHPPIDYVHRIKLDPSCSGVARIGEERFVDLEIDRSYTEALFNARHAVESEDGKRLPVPVRVKIERRGDGDTMGVEDVTEERSGEAHAMEEAEALLLEPPEDQPELEDVITLPEEQVVFLDAPPSQWDQRVKEAVVEAVRTYPLISDSAHKGLFHCAESMEQWNSWSVGKQRAFEWKRARKMGDHVLLLCRTRIPMKRLLLWCRQNGHAPVPDNRFDHYSLPPPAQPTPQQQKKEEKKRKKREERERRRKEKHLEREKKRARRRERELRKEKERAQQAELERLKKMEREQFSSGRPSDIEKKGVGARVEPSALESSTTSGETQSLRLPMTKSTTPEVNRPKTVVAPVGVKPKPLSKRTSVKVLRSAWFCKYCGCPHVPLSKFCALQKECGRRLFPKRSNTSFTFCPYTIGLNSRNALVLLSSGEPLSSLCSTHNTPRCTRTNCAVIGTYSRPRFTTVEGWILDEMKQMHCNISNDVAGSSADAMDVEAAQPQHTNTDIVVALIKKAMTLFVGSMVQNASIVYMEQRNGTDKPLERSHKVLTPLHVYSAVTRTPKFDFLTNFGLLVPLISNTTAGATGTSPSMPSSHAYSGASGDHANSSEQALGAQVAAPARTQGGRST